MSDEELISAYVDGRMSEPERAAFEARVQADAALRRQVAVTRLLVDQSRQVESVPAPKNFILPRDFGQTAPPPAPAYRFDLRQWFFRLGSVAAAVVFMFAVAFDTLRTTVPAPAPLPAAAPMSAPMSAPAADAAAMATVAPAAGAMMAEATPMVEARSMVTEVLPAQGQGVPDAAAASAAESAPSASEMPAPAPEAQTPAQAMEAPAPQSQPEPLLSPIRVIAGVALLLALAFGIAGWLRR
jgi:hypothetical protein